MANFSMKPLGVNQMLKHWYQYVLLAILCLSVFFGAAYIIWLLLGVTRKWIAKRRMTVPPADTKDYIQSLSQNTKQFLPIRKVAGKPESFGVYYGQFADPPTSHQNRILTQWHTLVVDPLQQGVFQALSKSTSTYIIGRIDVGALTAGLSESDRVGKVKIITDTIVKSMGPRNGETPFNGVLLANWDTTITPGICNEIIGFLHHLNLNIYNEICSPRFMDEINSALKIELLAGVVFINGAIMPNGERRDYFNMLSMKNALEIVTAQSCLREFAVLMCEVWDVRPANAVVKRSFKWSSFYGAVSWIGSRDALTHADENTFVQQPDGAFEWLKREDVIDIHEIWRNNSKISETVCDVKLYESLEPFVPGITEACTLSTVDYSVYDDTVEPVVDIQHFDWVSKVVYRTVDPLSTSSHGLDYSGLGCFPIGMQASHAEFESLVQSQSRLLNLNLLQKIDSHQLKTFANSYKSLLTHNWSSPNNLSLVRGLIKAIEEKSEETVEVYIGLHTGFRTSDRTSQFWGLYDGDSQITRLYISRDAKDLPGTVLHTYLSSKRCLRSSCFEAEYALAVAMGSITSEKPLSNRMLQDIELLSPTETLIFLQNIAISGSSNNLVAAIRQRCEYQLIDVASAAQLKSLNTISYLRGDITIEELVAKRIEWYRQNKISQILRVDSTIHLFKTVEKVINNFLKYALRSQAEALVKLLETVIRPGQIDVRADILALAVFCSFRRFAYDEIYIDATDRCPLLNDQPDQAAVFAELWGLGSHCEAYLDVTPKALGKIFYDRYRAYYNEHPPPLEADDPVDFLTAYPSAKTDIDREGITDIGKGWQSKLKNTSYLGVFAVPALIDILLLTTIGRGLYLSAYMSEIEQRMSTYALVVALVLCGAVSSWIGAGGSYYLYAMVYPTMNMFMLTRFIGGMVLTSIMAVLALVIAGVIRGFYGGAIFLLYLMVLTIYLYLLALLANLQFPGSPLPSGRTALGQCLLILIISPILTTYVHGHDIVVYLCVLWGFAIILILRSRQVISKWNTWLMDVPSNSDQEVLDWYVKVYHNGDEKAIAHLTAPAAMELARSTLFTAVSKERAKVKFAKATLDENVRKLANAYSTTVFLLDWYSRYMQASKPMPYTSTWNLQVKVALNTLRNFDKGLRLHNGFIHWRHASSEIACGMLYFILALLDRWIELVCGGTLIGLQILTDNQSRIAVGLGLVYYLFGAVIMDIKASPLYEAVKKVSTERLHSAEHLTEVTKNDARNKRILYWGTLSEFLLIQTWGLVFTTTYVWVYVGGLKASILYLAYIVSYSGLLWFQYNRVFAGSKATRPLAFSVLLGLAIGLPLRLALPSVFWNDVTALGVACWTAAILTFMKAEVGAPPFGKLSLETRGGFAHSQKSIGITNAPDLDSMFDKLTGLPTEQRTVIKRDSAIGNEIVQILTSAKHAPKAVELRSAFPQAFALLERILVNWVSDETVLEIVPKEHMEDVCAVSRKVDGRLRIFVAMDLPRSGDITNCRVLAEAIVHETCEVSLGFSHSDAVIAEMLISFDEKLELPLRIKLQLEQSSAEQLHKFLHRRDEELARHICLGNDPDHGWENLPAKVRSLLLKRTASDAYEIDESQRDWIQSQQRIPYETFLARRDLHGCLTLLIDEYVATLLRDPSHKPASVAPVTVNPVTLAEHEVAPEKPTGVWHTVFCPISRLCRFLQIFVKFFVLAFIAEPEYQRELAYVLRGRFLKTPVMFIATCVWVYARIVQDVVMTFYLFYNRPHMKKLRTYMKKGTVTVMKGHRLVSHDLKKPSTSFVEYQEDGSVKLWQYAGEHTTRPDSAQLKSINYYSSSLAITRRQVFEKGRIVNEFIYEYAPSTKGSSKSRIPSTRICIEGSLAGQKLHYTSKGFIKSGEAVKEGIPFEFVYEYRRKARFDDELLRVRYTFASQSPLVAHVWWCVPPIRRADQPDRWIPFSRVTQATFVRDGNTYDTKWTYDHKCHPTLSTLLNGENSQTPEFILHDHLSILSKPTTTSFAEEDPLLPFNSATTSFITRLFGGHKRYTPVSTSRARTFLWRSWKESTQFDGVTARWLDEMALRADPVLKPYWRSRDFGRLHSAIKYLRTHGDAIMASVDVDHEISAWTALAFKMSDLFSLGQGGDTSINTRTTSSQINDTHEKLHVLATDTGTWPCEGGGVSCCRRDMVDNLQNIKWHIVAETANDYSIPRFQIEHNVQSLKILPLWGLDFLTPTHGIIENELDTAMEAKLIRTNDYDITEKFLPILTSLVRGARALEYNSTNIQEFTMMLVRLNTYFENRNWKAVWSSNIVKEHWRSLWLSNSMENTRSISTWFDIEKPTLLHLDEALELYSRYLFILSIPVPEQVPRIFQSTHHSIGATYGIVCKFKRHCTFQVWDHSIIWRECNTYLSSAQCSQAPFTRIALIGLMRLAAHLNMHNADVILPCTNFFNPGWEIELGSCEGVLTHRKKFARKIDPIVNGICNMESFDPIEMIKTEKPTVTMLSHVQYVKDVKNALLAADIIVNEWGFKDYRLDVYGGLDRTPSYTVECQEIIASKSLRGYVTLKGYGNPHKVLEDTWVFMNSSISEGMPLAIGEAALTGAPIVCTDVGATFQVLTDPDDPKKRYGTVIAPNDPRALAKAQISLLSVMDEWEVYGEDTVSPGPTPEKFTKEDVDRITKRMYDKTPQRRALGLQLRKIVQKSFSGDRYLREHEQMLWIGKYQNEAKRFQVAHKNHETVIEMLDDNDSNLQEEYRPRFLRDVSGFSAFGSAIDSSDASPSGTHTPRVESSSGSERYGPSRLQDLSEKGDKSDWEEDIEKQ